MAHSTLFQVLALLLLCHVFVPTRGQLSWNHNARYGRSQLQQEGAVRSLDNSEASIMANNEANKRSQYYKKLVADQLFRARRRYEDLMQRKYEADQETQY